MKYCTKCGSVLQDDANFCVNCGAPQQPVYPPVQPVREPDNGALATLCILTIIGSVFGILKGLFYESLDLDSLGIFSHGYFILGYLSAATCVGTLTGAVYMLKRQRKGYTIYVVAQVMNILLSLWRTIGFNFWQSNEADTFGNYHSYASHAISSFSIFLGAFFTLPSIVFIILYTTLVRKQLR